MVLEEDCLCEDLCMLFLFLRFKRLDLILGFYLIALDCFIFWYTVDLELGGGGVSESPESEIRSGDLTIGVITVLVTVPKNPQPKAESKEYCFI